MVGSAACNETELPSANCFVYLGKKTPNEPKKQPQIANQLKKTKNRQGIGRERGHTSAIREVLMIAEVSSVQCSFSRPVFPFICLFINSKIYLTFLCNFNPHIVKLALNWNRVKASVGILDFCLLSFISPHFACWLGGFCCVLCSDPTTQLTDVVRSLIFWSALHFKKCSSEWCRFLVQDSSSEWPCSGVTC